MSCAFQEPVLVRTPLGDLLPEESVRAACLSGAAYARRHLRLEQVGIEIVQADGTCEESESDGLAIATIVAIGAVTEKQGNISPGAFGDWEMVDGQV